jgi:hypothetical protein
MSRLTVKSLALVLLLVQLAHAQDASKAGDKKASPRWKVEYLRDGKWQNFWEFDTRQQAQAKIDSERTANKNLGWPLAVARVVPTDWNKWEKLGDLSAKYESGKRGPGTVSTGVGDPGGVSYGTYQFSSKAGSAQEFVDEFYADLFKGAEPGTDAFTKLWDTLAKDRPHELAAYEHLFIAETHYAPIATRLRKDLDLDLDKRSATLREVAWSTAVQHGPNNKVFSRALEPLLKTRNIDQITDGEIIECAYQERGRVDSAGVPVYFGKSSPDVQKAGLERFKDEANDAIRSLDGKTTTKMRLP